MHCGFCLHRVSPASIIATMGKLVNASAMGQAMVFLHAGWPELHTGVHGAMSTLLFLHVWQSLAERRAATAAALSDAAVQDAYRDLVGLALRQLQVRSDTSPPTTAHSSRNC